MYSLLGTGSPMGLATFFLFFFFSLPPHFSEHSISYNIVMKSLIGLKFWRSMLMDSLQGQLKMVWLR